MRRHSGWLPALAAGCLLVIPLSAQEPEKRLSIPELMERHPRLLEGWKSANPGRLLLRERKAGSGRCHSIRVIVPEVRSRMPVVPDERDAPASGVQGKTVVPMRIVPVDPGCEEPQVAR